MAKKINPDGRAHGNILALHSYLMANHTPISLTELKEKYKVSKATMLRYLDTLENAGYGKLLVEKRGRANYYSLDRPKTLPKISLSVEGLQQLALCRDFICHLLPNSNVQNIETALNQATAYLPNESNLQGLPQLASSFTRGKIDYTRFQEKFKLLLTAIRDNLVCTVTYKTNDYEQTFDYAPKQVIALGEAIHINGWKVTDKGTVKRIHDHPNNLLLHRIQDVVLTIRKGDKLPAITEHDSGYYGYMDDKDPFDATIRFYGYVAAYVSEREWSSEQEIIYNEDGSIDLTLAVQSRSELKTWILSFGENAKVLSPDWLKDEIVNSVKGIIEMYS